MSEPTFPDAKPGDNIIFPCGFCHKEHTFFVQSFGETIDKNNKGRLYCYIVKDGKECKLAYIQWVQRLPR